MAHQQTSGVSPVIPKAGQIVLFHREITPLDPFDIITTPWSPHFEHVAICTAPDEAVGAIGGKGVATQYANGQNAVGYTVQWDFEAVHKWLEGKMGLPYDWQAYLYISLPFFYPRSAPREDRYICSSLVGEALMKFSNLKFNALRSTTPDDIARAIGAL